ncbi:MAG: ATP-binding protein [Bryobacterales bacterium]|nr:ATP-binding protein [Bryobacteraceae bacterium]MDW8353687.1 ATP-binding protein [Bryobacterales bacterium]
MRWYRRLSLVWKIWLSTSVALTALFAITGWIVQRHALETTSRSLHEEAETSFQAYVSLWRARADMLRSVAAVIASMPNVRAAFGTRDPLTIRDAAQEVWNRVAHDLEESAFFLVADPEGNLVAVLGEPPPAPVPRSWELVRESRARFPDQVSGFAVRNGSLVQLVLTPVYVDSPRGPALLSVLVTGYTVTSHVARRLRQATGGSEFLFLSRGEVFASTLDPRATRRLAESVPQALAGQRVSDGAREYVPLLRDLVDAHGRPIGRLGIFRSFEAARQRVAALRRDIIRIWAAAMLAGLGLTWLLARRIIEPVKRLDVAAAEVARQNYDYRVQVASEDELGRLASTFNSMCQSLQEARRELIRQERISTIGRLASSIVHDLRNPLAAIYGAAEILMDTELPPSQVKRLAASLYKASRRIQELLQDLMNVARGRPVERELCRLVEVIEGAAENLAAAMQAHGIQLQIQVPNTLELPLARARMERVFFNLMHNAVEAMPSGGCVRVTAEAANGAVTVCVQDTGPGIAPEVRDQLFQPFASFGKKGGLGLGLALARQTVLDHGGEMWAESEPGRGARFYVRLPLEPRDASPAAPHVPNGATN